MVDGIWGSTTERVYVAVGPDVQRAADEAASESGYPISVIRPKKSSKYVSPSDMLSVITQVSAKSGVPGVVLQRFLDLEAARVIVDGQLFYVVDAKNSAGYVGLFQFDGRGNAWRAAARMGDLPDFSSNWADPYYNTLAAAYYLKANTVAIRTYGYKGAISGAIAYLMHNQGARGAYLILSGKRKIEGAQSAAATATIAEAIRDAGFVA